MFTLSNATLGLIRPSLISNNVSTYIKDTTNKSLEKYKNKVRFIIPNKSTDLTTDSYNYNGNTYNFFTLLPFVSLISFLAGYKLSICLRN